MHARIPSLSIAHIATPPETEKKHKMWLFQSKVTDQSFQYGVEVAFMAKRA